MRETKPNVVFVTGGAGFIGSAVVRELLTNSGAQVVVIDKLTYAGNLQSIPKEMKTSRFHFEKVDICDAANIRILFDKYRPDIVMHLAAESHVDRSIDGPMEFIQTNVVGTSVLLEASRQYWERYCQPEGAPFLFHHISTDEVYGDLPHPDDRGASPLPLFVESTPYAPSSPYSSSKASSDHLVRSWHRTYGLPTLVTNCSNNYGPYHFPEKLVPHVILNAISGKPLPIYGDGSQIRDWLYVEDHARALVLVATEGKTGETYNIGGHNEKRNIDVVRTLCDILNERVAQKPEGIADFKQLITYVADRPGHDRRYAIDASKIENELGWVPKESFESGLQKTVDWFLTHRWWWENVLSGSYKLERLGEGN